MKVSVIIPAYNRAESLGKTLDSVLAQSFTDFDVIVVDDASSDATPEVVQAYTDPRVRLVRHDVNQGAAAARNTGVKVASGAFIAFLDSDDRWMPDKLEKQLAFMAKAKARASTTGYRRILADGAVQDAAPLAAELGLEDFVWGCFTAPGATLVLEKSLWDELGGLDTDFPRLEDWDWVVRLGLAGEKLSVLPDILADVEFTAHPKAAPVLAGLEHMAHKHMQALKALGLDSAFRAALSVERAAQAHRDGAVFKAGVYVLESIVLKPFGNFALKRVIFPRIRAIFGASRLP